jgi:hypothetical protein
VPKLNQITFLLFISSLLYSCKDFIEPSIKDRQVTLNAPANNAQSTNYTVNFWWEEVEDALKYRLLIVTPKFDTVSVLVADTVIKGNKFAISLSPGTYQWRVRAENGSTQTAYSAPRQFTVLFSSIKQQKVQLGAPANNLLTNQPTLTFTWGNMYGATKYRLQLDTNSFTDETKLVYNQLTPAQQITYILRKEKAYQWRIRAENDTAQSQWSNINNFNYDHTPPAPVTLVAPANSQSVSLPVALQWNPATTATAYKVYVFKGDSTSKYNNSFPVQINTTTYNFNQGSFGERIYWKVTAIDAAGNESTASIMRSFILQ